MSTSFPKRKGIRGKRVKQIKSVNSESVWIPIAESMSELFGILGEMKNGMVDLERYKDTDEQPGIVDDVLHMKDDLTDLEKEIVKLCDKLDNLAEILGRK